jgi:5'(3')-deoxyribonucleotidase
MKKSIVIDVDGVILDSISAIALWYEQKYSNHPYYVKPNSKLEKSWNFKDTMSLMTSEDIKNAFNSTLFFDSVQFKPNVIEVLEKISKMDNVDLYICSIGSQINLVKKSILLHEKLPFIRNDRYVMIRDDNVEVSMGGKYLKFENPESMIILDDCTKNLTGFGTKVLFKDNGDNEWNQGITKDTIVVDSWLEFYDVITMLVYCEEYS